MKLCSIVGTETRSLPPTARGLRVQNGVCVRTVAFLVATGTPIHSIWDIQVSSLASVGLKRGLHLRNLRMLMSTLRFEYPVLAVV